MRGLLLLALILTGCGYRMGYGNLRDCYSTVSVPYVVGDNDGGVTAALIRELTSSGGFTYCCGGGELLVLATIIDISDTDIGFRYDRNKKGRPTHCVIPSEARITAMAEVTVQSADGALVLGPAIITASVEFDHDYYSSRNGVNSFSLGQITDVEDARDAVRYPLNRALARKIVDYINAAW